MNEKNNFSRGISVVDDNVNLTIKISNSHKPKNEILDYNIVPDTSVSSSPIYTPSVVSISPSSSAFYSALQSPYISPTRAKEDDSNHTYTSTTTNTTTTPNTFTQPSTPVSHCGSHSDDIPSTSYTPPSESYNFSDATKLNAPRISFSFSVPRISLSKGSVSPVLTTKLRSCDVYIGYHGQNPNLIRFCKWVKSELELQGIACFVADREKYSDSQSHEIADRVICSVTFGIVVVTKYSLLNYLTSEEIRFFGQKKNLIPMFFDTNLNEVIDILGCNSEGKDCKEALEWLMKFHEFNKLETNEGNWRCCVAKAAGILRGKLGRKSVADKEIENLDEIPFPKNRFFIGREKELAEIETTFFGCKDFQETDSTSEGLADEESEVLVAKNTLTRRKYKKTKSGKIKSYGSNVVCINGGSGMGKTELALEFAHRYSSRYKMVIWVGGEGQHLRQNILNLSNSLGLDLSADAEKEREKIRSFDEQETEAFKRVKRELFREMPYLLIIDNLETEKEWWEGKGLHDLIPRNTGSTHVIITTRLPKVMNFETMQLQPLPLSDAMLLITGRRKKQYTAQEVEFLGKFNERLGRSSFGLWVIGSLLCELNISPSTLFQAINQILIDQTSSHFDDPFWGNNHFLLKVLIFCFTVLNETKNHLALKMLLVGVWFAPSPISANLLAAAASHMNPSTNRFKKWAKSVKLSSFCCSGFLKSQSWKSEEDSAIVLVKLGLAKKSNKLPGCYIMFHPITHIFAERKGGLLAAKATIQSIKKIQNPILNSNHLWASVFLVFGFKSNPPLVQLKPLEMVQFIKKVALPLAIRAFTTFSRCNSGLELLKVCTNVLEEVEKSFVSQVEDSGCGSLFWNKKKKTNLNPNFNQRIDEYLWQDVTLLKATLLETRAKLLLRGAHFDYGEELCRTCISIRTVMLGHNHAQTLAAQETLSKLVRLRSKGII
ncbi:uncharacterized protein [Rutidosis leptorrhynchoides]|uniref:uncharacterized protein n=1 Tax=Rutidosis leptorrhynchoides TaxID=125765 RepID=UPI003A99257C